jgi:hypothetical protein
VIASGVAGKHAEKVGPSGATILRAINFRPLQQRFAADIRNEYSDLIRKIFLFFLEALVEVFEHFDGFFQFLVGFLELAVLFAEPDFFAG